MARGKSKGPQSHGFRNKLLLNQWLISLFGIDPLVEHILRGQKVRPFRLLADPIRDARYEGLDKDNLHYFYHYLGDSPLFSMAGVENDRFRISREMLLRYEENIVSHTRAINENRHRPVIWKYYQWLTLLFTVQIRGFRDVVQ